MENRKIKCKECKFCKIGGYTSIQNKARLRGGRAEYFCEHPKAYDMTDESGQYIYNFIGYGDGTTENTLKLKTYKKWCPLRTGLEKQ